MRSFVPRSAKLEATSRDGHTVTVDLGAGFLAAALLAVPAVAAAPLVAAVWLTCAAVAVR